MMPETIAPDLAGKSVLVTGASTGIGAATARAFAHAGCRVAIHYNASLNRAEEVAADVRFAGAEAFLVGGDLRTSAKAREVVDAAAAHFGGIDILINNASAISLTSTADTPMKRFDLMFGVNVRGTYLCTQACLPLLSKSAQAGRNPHVLNMSPPLSMREHWFKNHVAYTMAKYGMSECTLGHAGEFRALGIGVNSLWPRTVIATAALQLIPGVDIGRCRAPQILADAAWLILTSDAKKTSCNFFIDDEVLARAGITDLDKYSVTPGTKDFIPDFFVD
jgi:citronellol/citronellal dehydrogenase